MPGVVRSSASHSALKPPDIARGRDLGSQRVDAEQHAAVKGRCDRVGAEDPIHAD